MYLIHDYTSMGKRKTTCYVLCTLLYIQQGDEEEGHVGGWREATGTKKKSKKEKKNNGIYDMTATAQNYVFIFTKKKFKYKT